MIRNDFVSNSSSSSFVVNIEDNDYCTSTFKEVFNILINYVNHTTSIQSICLKLKENILKHCDIIKDAIMYKPVINDDIHPYLCFQIDYKDRSVYLQTNNLEILCYLNTKYIIDNIVKMSVNFNMDIECFGDDTRVHNKLSASTIKFDWER